MTTNPCSDIDFINQFLEIEDETYGFDKDIKKENTTAIDPYNLYGRKLEDKEEYFYNNLIINNSIFAPPVTCISKEVEDICRINKITYHFKSREDTRYFIRMSQCKINRRLTVPKSDSKIFHLWMKLLFLIQVGQQLSIFWLHPKMDLQYSEI
jgi:hypothetical protein